MLPCELAAGFTLKLTQQSEKGNEMFSGSARCKIVTAGVGSPLEGRTQEELLVWLTYLFDRTLQVACAMVRSETRHVNRP